MEKKNFHLVSGEVMSVNGEGETGITRINTMIMTENGNVTIRHLGRATQALQISAMKKMGDPTMQILDVVILTISYLGHMTEAEFNDGATDAAVTINSNESVN